MKGTKENLYDVKYILVTDVGSTTSKARFFQKKGDEYRYVISGEAPTTVEAPFEDVTVGVQNAIKEIEELTGHKILSEDEKRKIIMPRKSEKVGVDLYCTTSSAGGGLQMMVTGVVKVMTAESAERAALGAGAIIMDVLSTDDGYKEYERIKRLRSLRPDMILMAGGVDGGNVGHVMEMAEMIYAAEPKTRLGILYELPIVYAGNKQIRVQIKERLGEKFALKIVENVRPKLDIEETVGARNAVHELFMEHVMSHAPGYDKLMEWTDIPILPTPAAEGMMMQTLAKAHHTNVIGVGLGGATTNIYSIYNERFVRSVSANLGMSYSISNVLKQAGVENILRWVPFDVDEASLSNSLRNKMIRPTTLPETLRDLMIEHAVAREAIRLGFEHHKQLARALRGLKRERDVGSFFDQELIGLRTYIEMINIKMIAGTGGLLSHAPRRVQAALMLIDGFQPEGVTRLYVDSVFMMPHCGVLSTVLPKAALEIFEKDCLVNLGTIIAPAGTRREGEDAISLKIKMPNRKHVEETVPFGAIQRIPLEEGEKADIEIEPASGLDIGNGRGKSLEASIEGGVVGIITDARGRPLILPEDKDLKKEKLIDWFTSTKAYPNRLLKQR